MASRGARTEGASRPYPMGLARLIERTRAQQAQVAARTQALNAKLPAAAALLASRFGARRVVVFGSLAHGTTHEDSDVDLAVVGVAAEAHFRAAAAVGDLLQAPVDLVLIEEASPSLRKTIEADGVVLHDG